VLEPLRHLIRPSSAGTLYTSLVQHGVGLEPASGLIRLVFPALPENPESGHLQIVASQREGSPLVGMGASRMREAQLTNLRSKRPSVDGLEWGAREGEKLRKARDERLL
jgi:hypothetical protein